MFQGHPAQGNRSLGQANNDKDDPCVKACNSKYAKNIADWCKKVDPDTKVNECIASWTSNENNQHDTRGGAYAETAQYLPSTVAQIPLFTRYRVRVSAHI